MGLREIHEGPRDIRVPKDLPHNAEVHDKLEKLMKKIAYKEGRTVLKPELVIELLLTHPKTKSL